MPDLFDRQAQDKIDFKIYSYHKYMKERGYFVDDQVAEISMDVWRKMEDKRYTKDFIVDTITYNGVEQKRRINMESNKLSYMTEFENKLSYRELPFCRIDGRIVIVKPIVICDWKDVYGKNYKIKNEYPLNTKHLYSFVDEEEIAYLKMENEIKDEIVEELKDGKLKFKHGSICKHYGLNNLNDEAIKEIEEAVVDLAIARRKEEVDYLRVVEQILEQNGLNHVKISIDF